MALIKKGTNKKIVEYDCGTGSCRGSCGDY